MNTYNSTTFKWISLYWSHKSIPWVHEHKPPMALRSHLPKLPHPFIDEKTSSDKLSDLPKDTQQEYPSDHLKLKSFFICLIMLSLIKMLEVMWTTVSPQLQAKSTNLVEQNKEERIYSRILRPKVNCQVFGRQMSSKCSEGRQRTCSKKRPHHSEYSVGHSCVAVWQLVKEVGQTHILDNVPCTENPQKQVLSEVYQHPPLQWSPPNSFTEGLHRVSGFLGYTKIRLRDSGLHIWSE